MSLLLRANSVAFRGRKTTPRDGFYVDAGGFTGYDDGVDMRREVYPIPQGAGAFDVPGYQEPRTFGVVGRCYAASEGKLEWWHRVLTGLLADGGSTQVVVENRGMTTWTNARRATARPEFVPVPGGVIMARYRFQFWSANPRIFGDARVFTSGQPAYQYGNFAATELITVTGNEPSGYTIFGPNGKQFIVTAALVAGHPHTIDMSKGVGMLSIDGAYVMGGLGSRTDVWAIPAGAQVVATVSGSAALSRLVLDTFL